MGPRLPDVTVLLGDPTLPDASKPGGRFHREDLDCVARLRGALDLQWDCAATGLRNQ